MSELFDQGAELLPARTMMSMNFGGEGDDIFVSLGDSENNAGVASGENEGDTNAGVASGDNEGEIHDNLGRVHHFEVTPNATS